jgi:RimJ/RimL family protein N-acetyltransferase
MPWPFPERRQFSGRVTTLEPLSEAHVPDLWRAAQGAETSFDYLRYGPFANEQRLHETVVALAERENQPFWAVRRAESGAVQGWLSLCDIYPADGAIEIGSIWYAPTLQRTRAATEAIFLLMQYAFDTLGYERMVWRCSMANQPSLRAATRYGFTFEGVWRRAVIFKDRHFDLAWHSILADEWPAIRSAIATWLDDENFDESGRARARLGAFRESVAWKTIPRNNAYRE